MGKHSTLKKSTVFVLSFLLCVMLAVAGIAFNRSATAHADENPGPSQPCTEHDFSEDNGYIIYPQTCVTPGVGMHFCTVCGQGYTYTIPADGTSHDVDLGKGECNICGKKVAFSLQEDNSDPKNPVVVVQGVKDSPETEVIIPKEYNGKKVVVAENAFAGNTTITDVTIQGTAEIGDNAFAGCTGIKELELQDGTETIGANAFKDCSALDDVTIPETVVSVGEDAFTGTAWEEKSWTDGEQFDSLYNGKFLLKVKVAEVAPVPAPRLARAATALENGGGQYKYTVNNGTLVIADGAFKGLDALDFVELPATLKTVGQDAFAGCSALKGVVLPVIGENVYTDIGGLTGLGEIAWFYYGTSENWLTSFADKLPGVHVYYFSAATPADESDYWRNVNGTPTIWVMKSLKLSGYTAEYYIGDEFSTDGLTVAVVYDDDSERALDAEDYKVTYTPDMTKAGEFTVTVSYEKGNLTATYTVKVIPHTYNVTIVYGNGTEDKADTATEQVPYTLPAAPVWEGHEFLGWKVGEAEELQEADAQVQITANTTITAQWEQLYTVTAQQNDHVKATFSQEGYLHNDTEVTFTLEVDAGYKVTVMNGTETLTADGSGAYKVTINEANIEIAFNAEQVEIKFVFKEAENVAAPEVTRSENGATATVAKPQDPAKTKFRFTGWTVEVSGAEFVNNEGALTLTLAHADVTVTYTATWIEQVTVTYSLGEGENNHAAADVQAPAAKTGDKGLTVKLPDALAAAEGWEFYGWNVNGEEKMAGTEITVNADVTVTAIWDSTKFTITVDSTNATKKFYVGHAFDTNGLIVKKDYESDRREDETLQAGDYTFELFQGEQKYSFVDDTNIFKNANGKTPAGSYTVHIYVDGTEYGEPYTVEVIMFGLQEETLITVYYVGERYEPRKTLVLLEYWDNGQTAEWKGEGVFNVFESNQNVTAGDRIFTQEDVERGSIEFVVTRAEQNVKYTVVVKPLSEATYNGIELNTEKVQNNFTEGDELTYDNLVVTAKYTGVKNAENEPREFSIVLTEGYSVLADGLDEERKLTTASQTVTVTYQDQTATYNITVESKPLALLSSVTVALKEEKTFYTGDTLTAQDLTVMAHFGEDDVREVFDYTLSIEKDGKVIENAFTEEGTYTIKVTYQYGEVSQTGEYTLEVQFTGLKVEVLKSFHVGDTLTKSDFTVTYYPRAGEPVVQTNVIMRVGAPGGIDPMETYKFEEAKTFTVYLLVYLTVGGDATTSFDIEVAPAEGESETFAVTLTVNNGGNEGNTAELDPKEGDAIAKDTQMTLTITLQQGYTVEVKINDEPVDLQGALTYTITVDAAKSIVVTFTQSGEEPPQVKNLEITSIIQYGGEWISVTMSHEDMQSIQDIVKSVRVNGTLQSGNDFVVARDVQFNIHAIRAPEPYPETYTFIFYSDDAGQTEIARAVYPKTDKQPSDVQFKVENAGEGNTAALESESYFIGDVVKINLTIAEGYIAIIDDDGVTKILQSGETSYETLEIGAQKSLTVTFERKPEEYDFYFPHANGTARTEYIVFLRFFDKEGKPVQLETEPVVTANYTRGSQSGEATVAVEYATDAYKISMTVNGLPSDSEVTELAYKIQAKGIDASEKSVSFGSSYSNLWKGETDEYRLYNSDGKIQNYGNENTEARATYYDIYNAEDIADANDAWFDNSDFTIKAMPLLYRVEKSEIATLDLLKYTLSVYGIQGQRRLMLLVYQTDTVDGVVRSSSMNDHTLSNIFTFEIGTEHDYDYLFAAPNKAQAQDNGNDAIEFVRGGIEKWGFSNAGDVFTKGIAERILFKLTKGDDAIYLALYWENENNLVIYQLDGEEGNKKEEIKKEITGGVTNGYLVYSGFNDWIKTLDNKYSDFAIEDKSWKISTKIIIKKDNGVYLYDGEWSE